MGAKDTSIAAQGGSIRLAKGQEARDTGVAPGGELDVIEIAGAIKWFDAGKGFGFIVPDAGGPDVLLHVTCLRRDGYQTAYEGARIVVEALNRPGGLQAFRILSMDETTARHPSQMPAARTHVQVEPTSGLERLEVKWFNRVRGFGFLSAGEGHPDIFIHMETLRRFGITELRPGQFVFARYGDGPKGLMVAGNPARWLGRRAVLALGVSRSGSTAREAMCG